MGICIGNTQKGSFLKSYSIYSSRSVFMFAIHCHTAKLILMKLCTYNSGVLNKVLVCFWFRKSYFQFAGGSFS